MLRSPNLTICAAEHEPANATQAMSDDINGASIVLLRVYLLGVHTLPELAVQLKMLCDKSRQVYS